MPSPRQKTEKTGRIGSTPLFPLKFHPAIGDDGQAGRGAAGGPGGVLRGPWRSALTCGARGADETPRTIVLYETGGTMTRFALCLAVLLPVAAHAESTFKTPDDKQPVREHVVVQFGDADVLPSVARVKQGGSVVWNNTSSSRAVVRFGADEVAKFECKPDLRPYWQTVEGGIESIPTGAASDRITFPCTLKPGKYAYKIALFGSMSEMDNPKVTLAGTIEVE